MGVVGTTDGLQHKEHHSKTHKAKRFSNRCKGTHVGLRAAAVGAVLHLTASVLCGTLGLIWTGNCEAKVQHNFSLVSPTVEEEFFVVLEQPLFPQCSL